MNEWIPVFETDQTYKAEIVKGILTEHDIEAVILNHQDSSFKVGTLEVMVREEEKQKATEIIKSIDCE